MNHKTTKSKNKEDNLKLRNFIRTIKIQNFLRINLILRRKESISRLKNFIRLENEIVGRGTKNKLT